MEPARLPTPLTDAAIYPVRGRDAVTGEKIDVVHIDDCRAIERKLGAWREAIIDELVICFVYSTAHDDDPRKAIGDLIEWNMRVALDPAVSSEAQALIERGQAEGVMVPCIYETRARAEPGASPILGPFVAWCRTHAFDCPNAAATNQGGNMSNEATAPRIELGATYVDRITRFSGVAVGRVEYISGCNQALIAPPVDGEGKMRDSQWLDEQRLSKVEGADVIVLDNSAPGFDREPPRR